MTRGALLPEESREWLLKAIDDGDVAAVECRTERDDTGVSYDVCVVLRSLSAHAFEVGEDQRGVWDMRVAFGRCDDNVAGGADFICVARRQQQVADEIARLVWTKP